MIHARHADVPRLPLYERPKDGGALPTPPGSPAKPAAPTPASAPPPPPTSPAPSTHAHSPARASQGADIDGSSFQHSLPPDLGAASYRFAGRTQPQPFTPAGFQASLPPGHALGHQSTGPEAPGATLFPTRARADFLPLPGRAPEPAFTPAGFQSALPPSHQFGRATLGTSASGATLFPSAIPRDHIPHRPQPSASSRKEASFGPMGLADSLPPVALATPAKPTGLLAGLKRFFGFG